MPFRDGAHDDLDTILETFDSWFETLGKADADFVYDAIIVYGSIKATVKEPQPDYEAYHDRYVRTFAERQAYRYIWDELKSPLGIEQLAAVGMYTLERLSQDDQSERNAGSDL